MFKNLTLENMEKTKIIILRENTGTRPSIQLIKDNGHEAVVKDFSRCGFIYKNTIGRIITFREKKAYKKIEGIKGVPRLYKDIAGYVLVVEKIDGNDLRILRKKRREIDPVFFDKLNELVKKCHERGIVHCDMRKAANIIKDKENNPFLIDWGAAIFQKEMRFPILNLIYKRLKKEDFRAVIKLKLRFCPNAVSLQEKENFFYQDNLEKFVRAVLNTGQKWLKKIFKHLDFFK